MKLGSSYYPDITAEAEWAGDLANMGKACLSLLRICDFAWTAMEPREGCYQFDWLDRFLNLAQEHGMQVILCTPTAGPPAWLCTQYPQVMVQQRDGTRRAFGGRRDVDMDSPIFRHFASAIATEMGKRYGHHPAVIGWQIDNELIGPEGAPPESHTLEGTFGFRQWLKARYGTIEALNHAWGTKFWSQEYSDWGEVGVPLNPRAVAGQVIDYSRYFTHSQVQFIISQREALRAVVGKQQWISTNSTAVFDRGIDHLEYAKAIDETGWDAYPGAAGNPYPEAFAGLAHDLFRSALGKPFWIFEADSALPDSHVSFLAEMRARGAKAILFWHWRNHPYNAENESDTICDNAGRPDPRRVQLLQQLAGRKELAAELPPALPRRKAAILYSPDCVRPELSHDPYRGKTFRYLDGLIRMYQPARQLGLGLDVARPEDRWEDNKLLLVPSMRLMDAEVARRLSRFVYEGGTVVACAKTAQQNATGVYYLTPGEVLAESFGFVQHRNVNVGPGLVAELDGRNYSCDCWAERLVPGTARVLGRFTGGALLGEAAVMVNEFGKGRVWYAAACCRELNLEIIRRAATECGLKWYENTDLEIGIVPDLCGESAWVCNYSAQVKVFAGQTIAPWNFIVA